MAMLLLRNAEVDKYFVLGTEKSALTYGVLREALHEDEMQDFENDFSKYLVGEKKDNSFVAFDIAAEDLEVINSKISKYPDRIHD
ncbi:hypothetical protein [Leuconostoc pseudomesenteroides]|uniref:hypothetical protein n=1 Tax=Leuconostoc pseudomesenteroides TaxID=33968 RepID=UPI0039E96EBC